MFAQRADEVIRELVTFVDVAAYFADEAFFAIGFWLRFYIFLIIGVAHCLLVTTTRASVTLQMNIP